MAPAQQVRFAERELTVDGATYRYVSIPDIPGTERLPLTLKVLLENAVRHAPSAEAGREVAERIVRSGLAGTAGDEIEFMPARVLFQDFTGVPVFVDFAAMRDAALARGADPALVNPRIPCTLVVDHSVTADVASCEEAAAENARIEAERNAERFSFLSWSAKSFDNVEIVPPGKGICHQLNIERFCTVVRTATSDGEDEPFAFFDTLVGTDSHTTTANGVGVLGWGVGGIEAEAAALGQPCAIRIPEVVGMRLTGSLHPGVSAMDVALAFAELLRAERVVGSLVECFGPGLSELTPTQRATIANMTPEYGATATYFPPDEATLAQLATFGREPGALELARAYLAAQGFTADTAEPVFARVLELDLSSVEPSLAGPSRPHDRVAVPALRERFRSALRDHGREPGEGVEVEFAAGTECVRHGAVAIAAITSCTTATDPAMMIAAGLVARSAVELGCEPRPWVKRVLAPGSHATTDLLARAGLIEPLARLGFSVCGWGCMSCIGNSGPIAPELAERAGELELASVLSGNRNFEGRIAPEVAQNYLCAPALVVAYALAGTVDVDLAHEPVCQGARGPVILADLLPADDEVAALVERFADRTLYDEAAHGLFEGDASWRLLGDRAPASTFPWDAASTYVRRPPFVDDAELVHPGAAIEGARCLVYLGDFVTTDHISPAGRIAPESPAARYLKEHGVEEGAFNSYGSRRGNHEVMMRGTFANVRLENRLASGRSGAWTRDPVSGETVTVFDAAESARAAGIPLVVVAGKMYGSGSSRDWAAKGPALLGVRAVIAESFERIHRSNLVGMGILPLELEEGVTAASLGLTGLETFSIEAVDWASGLPASRRVGVCATAPDGTETRFDAIARVDTPAEAAYMASGGILPYVLDGLIRGHAS